MGKDDEHHRPKTKNVARGIDPKIGILARYKEIVAENDEEHEAADLVGGGESDSQTLRQLQMAPIRQSRAKQAPKTGDLRPRREGSKKVTASVKRERSAKVNSSAQPSVEPQGSEQGVQPSAEQATQQGVEPTGPQGSEQGVKPSAEQAT
ncbi:uncharacterized protein LOC113278918 [Papaver somniferum]|uniref:uncharacterized protein LOC113278918 n=1 Tax=Papaver somniferum TaxID=3469 RepID=UPI000E6F46D5|nr:uncharacterized protein LOC113278918 [Papaver somniferum]